MLSEDDVHNGAVDDLNVRILSRPSGGNVPIEFERVEDEGIALVTALPKGAEQNANTVKQQLANRKARMPLVWLSSSDGEWALYDFNTDGVFDLALLAGGSRNRATCVCHRQEGCRKRGSGAGKAPAVEVLQGPGDSKRSEGVRGRGVRG